MIFLVLDVFDQRVFVTMGNCKRSVTILPMRERRENRALLDPFIGGDGILCF